MNRIDRIFKFRGNNILSIFLTAGYPELEDMPKLVAALEESGVDLIEIGMPYSDPLADGPTIQGTSQVALENGMTLELLFQQIKEVRKIAGIPLILMGYFNQVMQYGEQAFFERCVEVGIDGLILPDLPIEVYEASYRKMVEDLGLTISFLITPQTSTDRIRKIDALSTGFVYMVADASITGAKKGISPRQIEYFERIEAMELQNPCLIGFGISDRETYRTACQYANGAIIGSAFLKSLQKGAELVPSAQKFIQSIKINTHDHTASAADQ